MSASSEESAFFAVVGIVAVEMLLSFGVPAALFGVAWLIAPWVGGWAWTAAYGLSVIWLLLLMAGGIVSLIRHYLGPEEAP